MLDVADEALAAATAGLTSSYIHYEPYWVEGVPLTLGTVKAFAESGIPVRGAIQLQPPANVVPDAKPVTPPSGRPASSPPVQLPAQPDTLAAFREMKQAAASQQWASAIGQLAVVELRVGDVGNVFVAPPAVGSVITPSWAVVRSVPAAESSPAPAAGNGASKATAAAGKPGATAKPPPSAKPQAAAAAAVAPEDVPGVRELGRVLATLKEHARVYDEWRKCVRVYSMPPPDTGCNSMTYYDHMLSTVPYERQNVPVVLHALLEQV